MSILIKINSRMKLKFWDKNYLTFIIDDKRTATFDTQTLKNNTTLLAFVREGNSPSLEVIP